MLVDVVYYAYLSFDLFHVYVQRGATQMNTINSTQRSTEGQCIELLMQLRRSLTQQYDVRLAVYEVRYLTRIVSMLKHVFVMKGSLTCSS
jgi:hypothetical protein